MRRCIFAVLLLAATACSETQTAAQSAPAAQPQNADAVVAEIGGRKITLKELDEKWQAVDPAERARVTQLLYQNRRNTLDQMLGDLLIEEAAKAAGMPSAKYLEQEVGKRTKPVAEADIQQFYEANKDRAQGRTMEQLRGPIVEYLQSQREQQARAQIVDELMKKRGAAVRVMLDPPRQSVELALHDPSIGPVSAPVTIVEFSDYQ
jgi:sorbitol-specific phosphotransferase system component IIBC